jgi:Spy/CpxP family protein refolding chaperone
MKLMMAGRLVLAVAGVLIAGGLASAQGAGGEGMPGGGGMGSGFGEHRPPMEKAFGGAGGQFWNNPRTVAALKLTDDQRKAMDGILQEHRMKLVDLEASLKKAELEMQPLMKADTPDQAAILAQIDKVAQARAELEKANARYLLALRGKLTPDQWKQLQTMRQNRMDRGRDGERGQQRDGWGNGQRPGMGGQGNQFHRPMPQEPGAAPQGAPGAPPQEAPAPSGTGDVQ